MENSSGVREMQLSSGRKIGNGQPCFIIAEIGQNHQGDLDMAKTMIARAKECGADCVKFQKTCLKAKFTRAALARPYTSPHAWGSTYGQHKQYLELSEEQYALLQQYAEETVGIMFTASAMDEVSFDFLHSMKVPFIKIGSGDSNNIPLIRHAASKNVPLVISTGMLPSIAHIDRIYSTVKSFHSRFALLHCVSAYPTPLPEVNLQLVPALRERYPDIPIGYSGHEAGIEVCLAAVALGAQIIERHFTLDKGLKGSDHASSLDPAELSSLVSAVRNIELSLGSPTKRRQASEAPCYAKLGKCLVARGSIASGTVLDASHVAVKVAEPQGLCGSHYEEVMGRRLRRSVEADEALVEEDLEAELHA